MENKKKRSNSLLIVLYGALVLVLLFIAGLVYRYQPLVSKMDGTWEAKDQPFAIEIKSGHFIFENQNIQGNKGTDLIMEGKIVANGSDQYQGKDVKIKVIMDTTTMAQNQIDELKKQKNLYKITEAKDKLIFEYLPNTIKNAYEVSSADRLFNFHIVDYQYGLKVDKIKLRNQKFALDGIVLALKE